MMSFLGLAADSHDPEAPLGLGLLARKESDPEAPDPSERKQPGRIEALILLNWLPVGRAHDLAPGTRRGPPPSVSAGSRRSPSR